MSLYKTPSWLCEFAALWRHVASQLSAVPLVRKVRNLFCEQGKGGELWPGKIGNKTELFLVNILFLQWLPALESIVKYLRSGNAFMRRCSYIILQFQVAVTEKGSERRVNVTTFVCVCFSLTTSATIIPTDSRHPPRTSYNTPPFSLSSFLPFHIFPAVADCQRASFCFRCLLLL